MADDRAPADPEVVAPVVVLVDGLVVAADGPHDNAAIPAPRYEARLGARFPCNLGMH